MSWASYAIKRVFVSIGVLLVASVLVFSIVRLTPGDPAFIILGQYAREDSLIALRRQLGLHLPVWEQYYVWITDVITGDWGESLITGRDVYSDVAERYPRSLQIALMAIVFALVIAIPLGVKAGSDRNSRFDFVALFFSQLGISIPSFVSGIIMILLFAHYINILPASGHVPFTEDPVMSIAHTLMPAIALGIINGAIITRFVRSEMLDEINKAYIRTARAYGHPRRRVIRKYALRNVMTPTLTITGIQFGYMIGGIVIIEEVFAYPGLGRLLLNSLLQRDYPVIQMSILVLVATFIIVNTIVDLLYGWFDPKVRY